MKILFVGVFDTVGKSTNTSQLLAFKSLGHDVVGYNYKQKALLIGSEERDKHLCSLVEQRGFDLVVFSKCNFISVDTFEKISKITKTCLWFMDPLSTLRKHPETIEAAKIVDYFCCDKKNVLSEVLNINSNSFYVCEGFDSRNDAPHNIKKEHDITFIGNVYGNREALLNQIKKPVNIISNVYGENHAIEVSKSKINLNFCTGDGASDRVYKVLAARGFLLTDDWHGRPELFTDEKDMVIFKDIEDLNKKIEFYLSNPSQAKQIAEQGHQTVQNYTREHWAKRIIEIYEQIR